MIDFPNRSTFEARNQATLFQMDRAHAGQAIKAARRSMFEPWTQKRLAREAGVNQSHLSKLERGETALTVAMAAHLLRRMGILTLEVRVQSGEFLIDGREMRPATFNAYGLCLSMPDLERSDNG